MATLPKLGATLHNEMAHKALDCCDKAVAGIRKVLKGDGSLLTNAVLLGVVLGELFELRTALVEVIKIGRAAKAARKAAH